MSSKGSNRSQDAPNGKSDYAQEAPKDNRPQRSVERRDDVGSRDSEDANGRVN